jgi:hypothetical protein
VSISAVNPYRLPPGRWGVHYGRTLPRKLRSNRSGWCGLDGALSGPGWRISCAKCLIACKSAITALVTLSVSLLRKSISPMNRVLQSLRSQGSIELRNNRLIIRNKTRLYEIAEFDPKYLSGLQTLGTGAINACASASSTQTPPS